ncbi:MULTISPECIES: hydrogenase maturation nickel metallochaperone HypA [Haloarcula]|uniref:hydrogenase maturation nickel metallochaperone HypA/HybF n=1 Tax=Haloarcula TaxID=2237 RepID=UPI0023ED3257|nr:hydrogenase maturation nickel metallochaperone HypA [Halomicroarcula sp. XH51]
MHELAIADRLLDRAVSAARDAGAERVDGLTVELGTATHLVPEQVAFCLDAVAEDTPAEGATVTFERVSARGECSCGWHGELETLAETVAGVPDRRCPDCGAEVELTAGRECRLKTVEIPEAPTTRKTDQTDQT